jgi:regulator of RNase E activity RraA
MVVGDVDGALVVPRDVEGDVFNEALEKARTENIIRTELEQGMLAAEAFDKYGIL